MTRVLAILGLLSHLAAAFPGDAYLHPTLHFTPTYVSDQGYV